MRKLRFPSPEWAVFNLHVNNAGARALSCTKACFPGPEETDELEKHYKEGIMAIFQSPPTDVTRTFANFCFIFANKLEGKPK